MRRKKKNVRFRVPASFAFCTAFSKFPCQREAKHTARIHWYGTLIFVYLITSCHGHFAMDRSRWVSGAESGAVAQIDFNGRRAKGKCIKEQRCGLRRA